METEQLSVSPKVSRVNRRAKTTIGIVEGNLRESASNAVKGGGNDDRTTGLDIWDFPGSSPSKDVAGMEVDMVSRKVKQRSGDTDAVIDKVGKPRKRRAKTAPEESDSPDVLSLKRDVQRAPTPNGSPPGGTDTGQQALEHARAGSDDVASFKIDLSDPSLNLTASQKEQYQHLSATPSTAGSLPATFAEDNAFCYTDHKYSDAPSTIPYSTPPNPNRPEGDAQGSAASRMESTIHSQKRALSISPSRSGRSRRARSHHDVGGFKDNTAEVIAEKPKVRSRTSTNPTSHKCSDDVSVVDLTLPSLVHEKTKGTSQKAGRKRKVKEVDEDDQADELGSDDVAIGLPKEQYKPRPSRSRGSTALDDVLEGVDFSKRPEAHLKAKNKRRKTQEGDSSISATQIRAVSAGQHLEVKQSLLEQTESKDNELEENGGDLQGDVVDMVEVDRQVPQRVQRGKRKRTTDDSDQCPKRSDLGAKDDQDSAALDEKVDTKKPATRGRGRPRKKTEENIISVIAEPGSGDRVDNKAAELETHQPGPSEPETSVLEEKDANSPSKAQFHSTPPREIGAECPVKEPLTPISTPKKTAGKGPDKHSPLQSGRVPYRVGLSRRARIEPLLRSVRKP